jgi:hypothetical protein
MNVRLTWLANGLLLGGMVWLGTLGGMEVRARRVMPVEGDGSSMARLENDAASVGTASSVSALANAYLDRAQPGLATAVIEKTSPALRAQPEVAHVYARALFHRGRAREALAVAKSATDSCEEGSGCPAWLVAKTARQVAFFEQVVAAGIDDPDHDPAATQAAYLRSSHEVRLVAMR